MHRTYLCVNNNNNNNNNNSNKDFIPMLSIKILFTINSVKNNYFEFLLFKKKHLVLIRKKNISLKNIRIKNISFQ